MLCGYAIDSGPFSSTTSSARPWSASAAAPTPRPTPRSCPGRCAFWPPGRRERLAALAAAIGTDPGRTRSRASSSSAATRPASAPLGADRAKLRTRREAARAASSCSRRRPDADAATSVPPQPPGAPNDLCTGRLGDPNAPGNGRVTGPRSRVALRVTAERLAGYHAYTRKHSVNWALYILARIFMTPSSSSTSATPRTGREHARAQGRADRRRQPPQLPRPLRDRRLRCPGGGR